MHTMYPPAEHTHHAVTVVHTNDELLKDPTRMRLLQPGCRPLPQHIFIQIASLGELHHNRQVLSQKCHLQHASGGFGDTELAHEGLVTYATRDLQNRSIFIQVQVTIWGNCTRLNCCLFRPAASSVPATQLLPLVHSPSACRDNSCC